MPVVELREARTGASAKILPEVGFNCFEFRTPAAGHMIDVLYAEPGFEQGDKRPNMNGIPLLFPFPNRIVGSRFTWRGKEYSLQGLGTDGQGHAIHGLTLDRRWRVIARGENFAVGEFRLAVDAPDRRHMWPCDFIIQVGYRLERGVLRSDIRVCNPDQVLLPWGFGTHPYFRVPLVAGSQAGDCLVQAEHVTERWELVNCLPTGQRVPVAGRHDLREGQELAGLKLDDVYYVESNGEPVRSLVMDPRGGVQVLQLSDRVFRELVAYTPPHGNAVCLEPYTCPTDAVHMAEKGQDVGWQLLEPGHEWRTWIEIGAGPVLA